MSQSLRDLVLNLLIYDVFELVVSMEWKAFLEKLFPPWRIFVKYCVGLEVVREWWRDGSCCGPRGDTSGEDGVDE